MQTYGTAVPRIGSTIGRGLINRARVSARPMKMSQPARPTRAARTPTPSTRRY
jgi:hypothetical protein